MIVTRVCSCSNFNGFTIPLWREKKILFEALHSNTDLTFWPWNIYLEGSVCSCKYHAGFSFLPQGKVVSLVRWNGKNGKLFVTHLVLRCAVCACNLKMNTLQSLDSYLPERLANALLKQSRKSIRSILIFISDWRKIASFHYKKKNFRPSYW